MTRKKTVVRADAADGGDVHERARELGDAIQNHDADKARMADEQGDALAQVLAALGGITSRLNALEKPAPKEAPQPAAQKADAADDDDDDDRDERKRAKKLAAAQARADSVAHARGERAPPPMMAERVLAYRRRLLRSFQRDSKDFAKIDLDTVSGPAFDAVEGRIYADAYAAAANPSVPEDTLVERVTVDSSGRRISTFYGEPRTWMTQFAGNRQRLVGISTKG